MDQFIHRLGWNMILIVLIIPFILFELIYLNKVNYTSSIDLSRLRILVLLQNLNLFFRKHQIFFQFSKNFLVIV